MSTVYSKGIDKLSNEEKLAFYKNYFETVHCELESCGHEIGNQWVLYDDVLYYEDCFDWKWNDEKEKAVERIKSLTNEINELQAAYDISK